jgi:hypothetical protein
MINKCRIAARIFKADDIIREFRVQPVQLDGTEGSASLRVLFQGKKPTQTDSILIAVIDVGSRKPLFSKRFPLKETWTPR